MERTPQRSPVDDHRPTHHALRRVLLGAGLVLAVVILVAVAVYAVAFIMLAPMMQ